MGYLIYEHTNIILCRLFYIYFNLAPYPTVCDGTNHYGHSKQGAGQGLILKFFKNFILSKHFLKKFLT